MRTTGKGLYKWVKSQENVFWPGHGGGLLVYFDYNGVRCAGIISKTYYNGALSATSIAIRPMQVKDDIGSGAGLAVYKEFKENANKKP